MWRIGIEGDITSTTPQERFTAYSLEFVDGSIRLERVPEVYSGDSEQGFSAQYQDMPNQSLELDTQSVGTNISQGWIYFLVWE
jgi:hypothetical protein